MKAKEKRDRFGLNKEMIPELVENIFPFGIDLPKNQKKLLAVLIHISGIDGLDSEGYFYLENKYLVNLLGICEQSVIDNAKSLIVKGFIERQSGKQHKPSRYLITKLTEESRTKDFRTNDFSNKESRTKVFRTKDFSNKESRTKVLSDSKKLSSKPKKLSSKIENLSQDKDIDKEKEIDKELDKDKIYSYINNLEEKDFFEIIKKFEDRFNFNLIPNNTDKTKNAMDTNIELSKLNERFNNCARQFKQMMQTINELQTENNDMKQAIKELQLKVSELEAKQNKTSSNQDSSTSSKSTSTIGTSTKQEKSDSKPSNGSSLPTTHQDEEKPTESNSKASTPIVEDVDADAEYGLFTSAVEACEAKNIPYDGFTLLNFKNMVLQDLSKKNASYRVRKEVEDRIYKFIQDFNEKNVLKPSNEQSGIVAHQNDEKPTQGKETASTSISEDNAASSNDVDDLFDGIIISGKASKKDEVKPSSEESDSKEDSKEVKDLKMPKTVEGCFQRYLESVEDLTNPTKADLNWLKDCITQSCKIEGFDESFIQELKSKIDKYNEEKALKVEDSSKDEEDESFREDTVSIQDKSSTTNEKPSSGITTPKDEEKPTEGKEMPSNGKELRYLDRKTGKQYATEEEAQNDGANPMFLYDTKSGRCVFSYTSHSKPSNEKSGIVAHQDDLKPVEAKKMPSMSMSDSYAAAQKEIEDSMEGDFVSEPIPTQVMAIAV